jgi:exonuclease SbcD
MAFRFLAAGDIHLGRRPARVPLDQDASEFAPGCAWRALVRTAIAQKVDAIALTGDVVERDNRFYEAFSDLQGGVQELVDKGIRVLAIAGNHDFDVLPRLAGQIRGFDLLGEGGVWQAISLTSQDGTHVRFEGWSFPRGHVIENPLARYRPTMDDTPTVGLLHCDCQTQTSGYGPVSLADLKGCALDVWALGHIHAGGLLGDGSPVVFYTGSPQGLDPSEVGPHGAWLVTLEPGRRPELELQPLAALQWERIEIPLDATETESAMEQAVTQSVQRTHQAIKPHVGEARAVGCRLQLTGRTACHRHIPSLAARLVDDYRPSFDDILYFVESVQDETRPDVALEELARSRDPAGLLAARLLVLDRQEPAGGYQDLLVKAREAIAAQLTTTVFASLPDGGEPLTDDRVRGALLRAGFKALDQLLAQKEAAE